MGATPNTAFSGQPLPESVNDPYDSALYGQEQAAAALAKRPAQERATRNEEPNPYPPQADDRTGRFGS